MTGETSREWCAEVIQVDIAGVPDELRCRCDIVDGEHRGESHEAIIYWGSPR